MEVVKKLKRQKFLANKVEKRAAAMQSRKIYV